MTYNFDPDQWFDIKTALLKKKREEGLLDLREYEAALEALDIKHDEMWERLDGTLRIHEEDV